VYVANGARKKKKKERGDYEQLVDKVHQKHVDSHHLLQALTMFPRSSTMLGEGSLVIGKLPLPLLPPIAWLLLFMFCRF